MSNPPPPAPPPGTPPPRLRRSAIAAGFGVGAALGFLPLAFKGYAQIAPLAFDALALPVIAVVLACVPRTRPFGLGLLLACGLGWLVLLCLCSGVRFSR